MSSDPESFWTDILSEEPATISRELNSLSKDERTGLYSWSTEACGAGLVSD